MRDAYVEKDTVKIDGRFFRFFSLHKKEILKGIKIGKVNKGEFELVEKRMKSVIRCLNEDFLKRYARKSGIRKWHHGLIQLGKISQSIVLEQPSRINIDAFIPPELQSLTTFLDEFS
jgi:hypothetical protein